MDSSPTVHPQTVASSSLREKTWPGLVRKNASRSNSRVVSSTFLTGQDGLPGTQIEREVAIAQDPRPVGSRRSLELGAARPGRAGRARVG